MKALDATIDELFARYPQLCGFSVQDVAGLARERIADQLEGELFLADLGLYPLAVEAALDEMLGEIAVALLDVIDEDPEARSAIRGRTFARARH